MSKAQKNLENILNILGRFAPFGCCKRQFSFEPYMSGLASGTPVHLSIFRKSFLVENNSIKTKILFGPQKMPMTQKIIKT